MIKSGWKSERDDRAPWGHVNKDSLFHSLPFLLSPCLCTPPSLPLTKARGARSLLHSLAFFSLLPTPPLLAPFLLLSSYFLSCFLPPSSLLGSSLTTIPPLNPSGRRSAQCQEGKGKEARGRWVGGWERKGERVVVVVVMVTEMGPRPLVKLDGGGAAENIQACRDEQTERRSKASRPSWEDDPCCCLCRKWKRNILM